MSTNNRNQAASEKERFEYDTIEFTDYLSGGSMVNMPLWTGPRACRNLVSNNPQALSSEQ